MRCYDDIISLPRHVSKHRAPMPRSNRAAQFSPFAALTGYDAEINEAMRSTYPQIFVALDMQEEINEKLIALVSNVKNRPQIRITYFVPDEKKSGGSYVTAEGNLMRYDEYKNSIQLVDGRKIDVDSIYRIE